ncbi:hypothetical protein F4779DRAFT_49174 [Xylariaceae sp. FL0662B]|nr:hypothetical protein F4779DRAFT_49174 [Xylariaceae sp. FL0662B]
MSRMPTILAPGQADQLKLVAAAAAFTYVGSTFANDIVHLLHRTAAGRAAYKWVHKNPASARCFLLAGTGALALAWPSTIAKLISYVGGIGVGKDNTGFSMRGGATVGTTGFVGIIQGAVAGRGAGVAIVRRVALAFTGLSGVGAVVAWQWRRAVHFVGSLHRKTDDTIRERKDKDRDRKDKGASSSSSRRDRLFSPPPPPPPPPPHDVEVSDDGESIHSKRSSSGKGEKKHRKHRK